jgi:hypothetical protein
MDSFKEDFLPNIREDLLHKIGGKYSEEKFEGENITPNVI